MLLWLCLLRRALIPVLLLAAAAAQAPPAPRITQAVSDRQLTRLAGNTIALASAANDRGAAAPELALDHMLLVLRHSDRQQADLRQLLDELRENDSPRYHQWLTPAEFGARFGPAPADVAIVTAWLAGEGFHLDQIAPGGGTIEFSGTAADVAAAFHTQMRRYQARGAMHLSNATDPAIPAALAPVVAGVVSLNDFRSHPNSRIVGQFQAPVTEPGTLPNLNYTQNGVVGHALVPGDLAKIYGLGHAPGASGQDGSGQTIAIVARSDVYPNDIPQFRSLFGAASEGSFTTVQVANDPGIATGDNAGDAGEATLDAEWANALAPAANVVMVVAASTNTTDGVDLAAQYIVDHDLAPVMSTSFGQCEALFGAAENTFWANLWEQAAAEGITALVSSGDNGAAGCDDPSSGKLASQGLAVSGIASTPDNTAVGGSELNEGTGSYWSTANGSFVTALGYIPEGVWNESSAASGNISLWAGSGGKSVVYAKPPWQASAGVPSDGARDLPDVSLTAASHDGYVLCFNNSCQLVNGGFRFGVVAGTSASAPAWAGIMALIDQQQGGRVGLANPVLYKLADSGVFHDVTTGNNQVPCAAGSPDCTAAGTLGYAAGPGFDLATGLGTPTIANLLQQWGSVKFAASTTTLQLTLPQNLTYGQSVPVSIQVSAASSGPIPTGNVVLLRRTGSAESEIQTYPLDTNGHLSDSVVLPAGAYAVVARYSGDLTYGASTSAPVTVKIVQATPTVVIELSATDPHGQPVPMANASFGDTVSAKVTVAVPGGPTPTGTVQLVSTTPGSSTPFQPGPLPLDDSGSATFTDSASQGAGTFSFTARYSGDDNSTAASSVAATLVIAKTATTLQITGVTAAGVNIVMRTANGSLPQYPSTFVITASAAGKTVTFFTSYAATSDPTTGEPELDVVATFSTPVTGTSATYVAQSSGNFDYLPSTSAPFDAPTPPNPVFVPSRLDFDPIAIGTSSSKTLTITNAGGMAAVLHLDAMSVAFTTTNDCGNALAPGASCTAQVKFTPYTGTTSYAGALGTGQPGAATVPLSGYSLGLALTALQNGSPLDAVTPASFRLELSPIHGLTGPVELACGGLPDFTTCHFSPAIPVLDGAATTPVTLTVSYSPPAAAMLLPSRRNTPWGLILAGLAGLVLVVLMPVARPVRPLVWLGCLLTLAACGGGGGGSLPASGGAISPPPTPSQAAVQLIPSHMDFGAVQVGESSATQTFAITNPGTAPLRLNSLGVVGVGGNGTDFRQTNTCAVTLNPGGQCSVGVQFVPSAVGARSGTFEVNLAGSSSPQTAMVTGTGVHTELVPATYWFTVTAQAGGQSQPLQLALIVH